MPILKARNLTFWSDRGDVNLKVLAATFAVAANLLFGLYLMRAMSTQVSVKNASANRTPIVWISKALPIVHQTPPSFPPRVGTANTRTSKEPQSLRALQGKPNHAAPDSAEAPLTDEDRPQSNRSAAGKPNLSLKPVDIDFAPSFMRRSMQPMELAPLKMRLQFADRSWGGRLRSMTKGAICKELAKSLSNSPESAQAILRSMRENDCRS